MGRPKKDKTITTIVNKNGALPDVESPIYCVSCGMDFGNMNMGKFTRNTFGSRSSIWKHYKRILVCKECLAKEYDELAKRCSYDATRAMYFFCERYDYPFYNNTVEGAKKLAEKQGSHITGCYISMMNSLVAKNNYANCFLDGERIEFEDPENEGTLKKRCRGSRLSESDKQNKKDVLDILGFDPFENENEADKKFLYNNLIDFLDDSTQEDNFKIPIVIEIVRTFNQIDKINQMLAQICSESNAFAKAKEIKDLIETKNKALSSINAMAKENGISANNNNQKSKGSGTFSGVLKDLQTKGFVEAEVNLFDIETCEGMKQVADISNRSILDQIRLDENTYTEMLQEQRNIIKELDDKNIGLEEELRLIKIELARAKAGEQ